MINRDDLIPDPLISSQTYCRYYHLGLEAFEDGEIIDEINALRPFLWGEPPDSWLRQRVARLEAEIQRRQEPKARHTGGVRQ